MDDIYNIKYKKYKKKYILLKQLIQEGGFLDYIGEGTSGCLFCPPFNPGTPIILPFQIQTYPEKNIKFNFEIYNNCNYVGKILAIKEQVSRGDSYENEIKQLLKIKNLDPNGNYTPELIYANVHSKEELLQILEEEKDKDKDKDMLNISNCINKKITLEKYGYIISKHTGISLESKYNELIPPETNIKKFFNKFNELLQFIKKLYDNNYLHLDIKINNITVKQEEDDKLYLIDFGRAIELKEDTDYDNIFRLLHQNNFMYSFEPKIYNNLHNSKETNLSFKQIIKYIRMNNFKKAINPYDYTNYTDYNMDILNRIFNKIDIKTESQQKYFNDYLEKCCCKYYHDKKDEFFKTNKNDFFEIYRDNFFDKYKNDFLKKYQNPNKDEDEYEDKFWEEYKDIFWEEYKSRFIDKYGVENIEKKFLLKYIFYPIIKKFDMYCMGIVLAEVVLFNFKFDDLIKKFKDKFINLIKKLLFHEFDNVDEIITEIEKLILLI